MCKKICHTFLLRQSHSGGELWELISSQSNLTGEFAHLSMSHKDQLERRRTRIRHCSQPPANDLQATVVRGVVYLSNPKRRSTASPSDMACFFASSTSVIPALTDSSFVRPPCQAWWAACRTWCNVGRTFLPSEVKYVFREDRANPSDSSRAVGITWRWSSSGCDLRRNLGIGVSEAKLVECFFSFLHGRQSQRMCTEPSDLPDLQKTSNLYQLAGEHTACTAWWCFGMSS